MVADIIGAAESDGEDQEERFRIQRETKGGYDTFYVEEWKLYGHAPKRTWQWRRVGDPRNSLEGAKMLIDEIIIHRAPTVTSVVMTFDKDGNPL